MNVVEELKRKLENADADEISALEQTEEPAYWFLLLAEYPEFAPDGMWWFGLRNHCDLPWSQLLAAQPRFVRFCFWENVSRLELVLLAYRAPKIFKRHFPKGRPHDLYAFLTPQENPVCSPNFLNTPNLSTGMRSMWNFLSASGSACSQINRSLKSILIGAQLKNSLITIGICC